MTEHERHQQPAPLDCWRESQRLLHGAAASVMPQGFGELDDHCQLPPQQDCGAIVTARMTHCFSLGALLGWPGFGELAEHGVDALWTHFRDPVHGGFFTRTGEPRGNGEKRAYPHMFVLLASSSALTAGVPGAERLLEHAAQIVEDRFWSAADAAVTERWDRTFATAEPYWGANANMHAVEAMLAAAAATGEEAWRERAHAIARTFIDGHGRRADWLLPEHYTAGWDVDRGYNRDHPDDEFRPYGVTIGHLFEWSRLLLELASAYDSGDERAAWLLPASRSLFEVATRAGWAADGEPGFVYTVDWDTTPVVRQRLHWVAAEAIAAAAGWAEIEQPGQAGDADQRLQQWLGYAATFLVDVEDGGWHHELDQHNRPASTIMEGKPDLYHALQACLLTELPVAPSVAARITRPGPWRSIPWLHHSELAPAR